MRLITFTLLPLVVLSIFSVILGNEFATMPYDYGENGGSNCPPGMGWNCPEEAGEGDAGTIGIDALTGAIVILVVIATASALLGIKVLGSGLSDDSVRVLITVTIYASIWTILSLLAIPLIYAIELFGTLLYVALTIGYVIGVMDKISGVGD